MEQDFNANLRRLRKQKGLTQEQLADAVGVSAQAVSKWEQNGFPDTPLLPVIADSLDVSIDTLFGREQDTPDLFNQVLKYLLSFSEQERTKYAFNLCWVICEVAMGNTYFDPLPDYYIQEDVNRYAQIINNNGLIQAKVNDSLQYFLLLPEPKNGYDSFLGYDKRYVKFFETLAFPDALRALYFLTENNNSFTSSSFFTEQTIARALSIETDHAKEIIQKFLSASLIKEGSLDTGAEKESIYYYTAGHNFISLMTFVHTLLNPPTFFCCHSVNRCDPLFQKATYRNAPESSKRL